MDDFQDIINDLADDESLPDGAKNDADAIVQATRDRFAKGISEQLGVSDTLASQEIGRLILDGKKIEAIKAYRKQTGMGLKESKEAIEKIMARSGIVPQSAGCGAAVLMMVGSGISLVAVFYGYLFVLKFLQ